MTTSRTLVCSVGAALALTVGAGTAQAAAPAPALRTAERVTVRTAAVTGSLRLVAQTAGTRTTLTVNGTLTTRSAQVRITVHRCGDTACSSRRRTAVGGRALPRGRSRPAVQWRTRAATRLRVALRVGRGTVVSTVLRPVAPAVAPAAAPATAAPAPAPSAGPGRVAADPDLVPAYDPAIPDYTVRCTPGQPVRLHITTPSGDVVAQDVLLVPGQAFAFTVGAAERHVVRCLPADFPRFTVTRNGRADVSWILLAPALGLPAGRTPYAMIVDRFGVPVWWMTSAGGGFSDVELLRDGSVALGLAAGGTIGFSRAHYERYALDGTPLAPLTTVGFDADVHDVVLLPNGNALMEAYVPREHVDLTPYGGPVDATVIDAIIQEVTPGGAVAWSWDSGDHIGPGETTAFGMASAATTLAGQPVYDLVHLNSIEPVADGDLVISARHLDAVYRIRRSDGSVDWKLGGTPTPESLTFDGDALGDFGGQHDARILPDGTLTVHDNGSGQGRPPRGVRYRLDLAARKATLVEAVADPRVPFSPCCGSSRRLPGGHWLMGWGGNGVTAELTAAGDPVLTLTQEPPAFSYRSLPLTSAQVDRTALRAAMDARQPLAAGG